MKKPARSNADKALCAYFTHRLNHVKYGRLLFTMPSNYSRSIRLLKLLNNG